MPSSCRPTSGSSSWRAAASSPRGCSRSTARRASSSAARRAWTRDEPVLVRNYDYPVAPRGHRLPDAVERRRGARHERLPVGAPRRDQRRGLAVSLTFGGRRDVGDGFAIPLVVRYVLETCDTVARRARRSRASRCTRPEPHAARPLGRLPDRVRRPGPRRRSSTRSRPPPTTRAGSSGRSTRGRSGPSSAGALRARAARRRGADAASASSGPFLEPPLHNTELRAGLRDALHRGVLARPRAASSTAGHGPWEQAFDRFGRVRPRRDVRGRVARGSETAVVVACERLPVAREHVARRRPARPAPPALPPAHHRDPLPIRRYQLSRNACIRVRATSGAEVGAWIAVAGSRSGASSQERTPRPTSCGCTVGGASTRTRPGPSARSHCAGERGPSTRRHRDLAGALEGPLPPRRRAGRASRHSGRCSSLAYTSLIEVPYSAGGPDRNVSVRGRQMHVRIDVPAVLGFISSR